MTAAHVVAVVGTGTMAGVFLAFSTSVMPALGERPAPDAIRVMQAANRRIVNPLFLLVFFGTAALGVVVAIDAIRGADGGAWTIAGAAAYLAGGVVVTIAVNVPRNDRVDALEPDDPGAAAYWAGYLVVWTRWNHLRTVACAASAALLAVGLASR